MFSFWLILIPFVVWQGRYEGPKVVWFLAGGLGLTLFWIRRLYQNSQGLVLSWRDFFFLVWLLILLLSSLLGVHPMGSIIGTSYRHQGILFFLTLWLTAKTIFILPKKEKAFLVKGLACGVIAEAVIVICQKLLGNLSFARPLGTFGNPNAVAGFLAIGSLFLFVAFGKKKLLGFLTAVFLAILLTGSRTGIFCFWIVLSQKLKHLTLKKWPIVAGIIILSLAVIYFGFRQRPYSKFENRQLFGQMALGFISAKPLLGWGAESQEYLYNKEFAKQEMPLEGMIVDRAHNIFLDVAICSGVLGLITFIGWLISEAILLGKETKRILVLGAWLVFSLFQPLGVVHWLLLVLIFNL